MDDAKVGRQRALSHRDYLDTLERPSATHSRRISEIQIQKELEINQRYHTVEEQEAATRIQRTYRGHRERRHLDGLTLDPSSRWLELIKEWRFRNATAPHASSHSYGPDGRPRTPSDVAKSNWRRAGEITEHAGTGDTGLLPVEQPTESTTPAQRPRSKTESSILLDLRYFLEMVDQKHRYGANLQVYHEEWKRSGVDQTFFQWLDYGEGIHLDLPLMRREKLERERIRYLSRDERFDYLVRIDADGLLRWEKNGELITTSADYEDSIHGVVPKGTAEEASSDDEASPLPSSYDESSSSLAATDTHNATNVFLSPNLAPNIPNPAPSDPAALSDPILPDAIPSPTFAAQQEQHPTRKHPNKPSVHISPTTLLNSLLRASVKPGTWIYVADTVGRLYVGIKASGAFQHASFLAGARISSAGAVRVAAGRLLHLSPLSGHYRPTTRSFREFVTRLRADGADLTALKISKTYAVVLGLEYYGRTKSEVKRLWRREKEEGDRKPDEEVHATGGKGETRAEEGMLADGRRDHDEQGGLSGLLHDLNFRRHFPK